MNFTGKLEGLKMDYVTRKQSLSLEVNEDARDAFQELKDCEKLVIQIKKYRKKRSLDANAYYWVLITKLARRLELSNPEMHNMCLERYGQLEIMENKAVFVTIPDTEEAENKVRNAMDYTCSQHRRYGKEQMGFCIGLIDCFEVVTHIIQKKWRD